MNVVRVVMWLNAWLMFDVPQQVVIGHPTLSATPPEIVQRQNSVQVTQFAPAVSSGRVGYYRLTFTYKFSLSQPLFIKGIGQVRPEGTLSYLTTTHTLTFTSQTGQVLKAVPLAQTDMPEGEGAGAEMPEPTKFPKQALSFTCSARLDENQYGAILSQFFAEGYYPLIENNTKWYTTPYQPLALPTASTKRAEISLRISAPIAVAGQRGVRNFQMQRLVRERGVKSAAWATTVSDATMREALAFQNRVIKRLQAGQ